jgi:hypothetical protein
MELNSDQKILLLEKIQNPEWKTICPVCQHDEWQVSDTIYGIQEFGLTSNKPLKKKVYPCVIITCPNCGNTLFLNAVILGVLNPQKPILEGEK